MTDLENAVQFLVARICYEMELIEHRPLLFDDLRGEAKRKAIARYQETPRGKIIAEYVHLRTDVPAAPDVYDHLNLSTALDGCKLFNLHAIEAITTACILTAQKLMGVTAHE